MFCQIWFWCFAVFLLLSAKGFIFYWPPGNKPACSVSRCGAGHEMLAATSLLTQIIETCISMAWLCVPHSSSDPSVPLLSGSSCWALSCRGRGYDLGIFLVCPYPTFFVWLKRLGGQQSRFQTISPPGQISSAKLCPQSIAQKCNFQMKTSQTANTN